MFIYVHDFTGLTCKSNSERRTHVILYYLPRSAVTADFKAKIHLNRRRCTACRSLDATSRPTSITRNVPHTSCTRTGGVRPTDYTFNIIAE